jgi:hypothetical protein
VGNPGDGLPELGVAVDLDDSPGRHLRATELRAVSVEADILAGQLGEMLNLDLQLSLPGLGGA